MTQEDGSGDGTAIEGDGGFRRSATDEIDQRIIDFLSWILETETRARIYVYLLAEPESTSDEIAQGTGLYPSTVREALAALHEEGKLARQKRQSEGAGNNPYEYTAIKPSELVGGVIDQVQSELNTVFTLDRILDRSDDVRFEPGVEPVTITVDEASTDTTDTTDGEPPDTEEGDSDSSGGRSE